ncbi:MAG: ABC transporter substrate-binding protein [Acetobacteraceae bacterium]
MHFDRVEWAYIPDPSTATSALINREAMWQEYAYADQLPLLRRGKNITVQTNDHTGFVNMMRLNHLQPPFNNPAIRRALWSAIDQTEYMQAIVGTDDPDLIRNPLASSAPARRCFGCRDAGADLAARPGACPAGGEGCWLQGRDGAADGALHLAGAVRAGAGGGGHAEAPAA